MKQKIFYLIACAISAILIMGLFGCSSTGSFNEKPSVPQNFVTSDSDLEEESVDKVQSDPKTGQAFTQPIPGGPVVLVVTPPSRNMLKVTPDKLIFTENDEKLSFVFKVMQKNHVGKDVYIQSVDADGNPVWKKYTPVWRVDGNIVEADANGWIVVNPEVLSQPQLAKIYAEATVEISKNDMPGSKTYIAVSACKLERSGTNCGDGTIPSTSSSFKEKLVYGELFIANTDLAVVNISIDETFSPIPSRNYLTKVDILLSNSNPDAPLYLPGTPDIGPGLLALDVEFTVPTGKNGVSGIFQILDDGTITPLTWYERKGGSSRAELMLPIDPKSFQRDSTGMAFKKISLLINDTQSQWNFFNVQAWFDSNPQIARGNQINVLETDEIIKSATNNNYRLATFPLWPSPYDFTITETFSAGGQLNQPVSVEVAYQRTDVAKAAGFTNSQAMLSEPLDVLAFFTITSKDARASGPKLISSATMGNEAIIPRKQNDVTGNAISGNVNAYYYHFVHFEPNEETKTVTYMINPSLTGNYTMDAHINYFANPSKEAASYLLLEYDSGAVLKKLNNHATIKFVVKNTGTQAR